MGLSEQGEGPGWGAELSGQSEGIWTLVSTLPLVCVRRFCFKKLNLKKNVDNW